MNKILSSIFLCAAHFFIFAQSSYFDHYTAQRPQGSPPEFYKKTLEELTTDYLEKITLISEDKKKDYTSSQSFMLYSMLRNGDVLYGDTMTKFVQMVGNKLLENSSKLKDEIQFFVIKNNITNAYCTGPGVIFVTTGLLSQIENEAQLAFILAHEISHYTEKHQEEQYVEKNGDSDWDSDLTYSNLVSHSRLKEKEADLKGIELYYNAGYTKAEIDPTFIVLMYSYLPFNEIPIDSTFFGNSNVYIPQSYFPESPTPIESFEAYDDSKSTHPNIKKRKEAIQKEINKYLNWQNNIQFFSKESFDFVQNIARFEVLREHILQANYVEALYDAFILEKQFPNSDYIQFAKALSWYQMNLFYITRKKVSMLKNSSKKEGAISMLYGFLRKIGKKEMALLSMRVIEDIYLKNKDNKEIKAIRNANIEALALVRSLDINKLETISYNEALLLSKKAASDTNKVVKKPEVIGNPNKYDRIMSTRVSQGSIKSTRSLDDGNFAYYLLYDLADSEEFHEIYKKARSEKNAEELTSTDKKTKKSTFQGNIIVFNTYLEAKIKNRIDIDETKKLYELYNVAFEKRIKKSKLKNIHNLSTLFSANFTTKNYKTTCLIADYIRQVNNKIEGAKFIRLNMDEMKSFISKDDKSILLMVKGEANNNRGLRNDYLKGVAFYIDLANNQIERNSSYFVKMRMNKISVGGLAFEVLYKFKHYK